MTTLSPRFADALTFAADVHRDQVRKGTDVPYASHLLAVAALVLEAGGDEDQVVAGLLHDALEDHPDRVSSAALAERFGDEVARIVVACSDTTGPDPAAKPPWRARKEHHLEALRTADQAVLLVSLCDKLHNATTLRRDLAAHGPEAWSRFKAGPADQLWYHGTLVAIFRERRPGPLTEEYAATVATIRSMTVV